MSRVPFNFLLVPSLIFQAVIFRRKGQEEKINRGAVNTNLNANAFRGDKQNAIVRQDRKK